MGSPLEPSKDPENLPEFQNLTDEEFQKRAARYYAERDVFAFSTILSLNWSLLRGKKQLGFLKSVQSYVIQKAEKHCKKGNLDEFKRIMET